MNNNWFEWLKQHLGLAWLFIVSAVVVAAMGASQLRLDGDLSRLLPDETESVLELERLERVYGDHIGRLTVVLQSERSEVRRRVAAHAADRLARLNGVDRVTYQRPAYELQHLQLLYANLDDLKEVEKRLAERMRWEKSRANPLFVAVDDAQPPSVDVSEIESRYLGGRADERWFENKDGALLVFVHPSFPASDLDRTEQLIDSVHAGLSGVITRHGSGAVTYDLTGRYQKRIEQQRVLTEDIRRATTVAAVLLFLFLWVYFRQLWSVFLVVTPLGVGILMAGGAATVLVGELNILTGFLGAVLLGLGVDYGIHLVSRLSVTVGRPVRAVDILTEAFAVTGRANVYAGITTAMALGTLAFSGFRAFHEFGVIAFVGLGLILGSYMLVLPALVLVSPRLRQWGRRLVLPAERLPQPSHFLPPGVVRESEIGLLSRPSLAARFASRIEKALGPIGEGARRLLWARFYGIGMLVVSLMLVVCAVGMSSVKLDRSFDRLMFTDSPTWELDELVNEVLGGSQTPAVVLVEDNAHRDAVERTLATRRVESPHGHLIGDVISTADIVPDRQSEKIDVLRRILDHVRELPNSVVREEPKIGEFRDKVRKVVKQGRVALRDLPRSIVTPFTRTDSEVGSAVLILPNANLNDWLEARRFARLVSDLPAGRPDETSIAAISESRLLVDIFDQMEADFRWMLPTVFGAMLLVAAMVFGFRREFWFLAAMLSGGLVMVVGALGLFSVPFNFMSALVIPVLVGLAVDAGFHTLLHLKGRHFHRREFIAAQGAIGGSFVTTMIGFGALLLAHHAGLRSMAMVAIAGIGTLLIFNLAVALILLAARQREETGVIESGR